MGSDPLFTRPPPCPECSTTLGEAAHPADEEGPEWWTYVCPTCTWAADCVEGERWTLATAPWTAPVVAAVLEVVDRHIDGAPEWDASPGTLALRSLREDLA